MASFSINAILGNLKQRKEETTDVALGQTCLDESKKQEVDLTGLRIF